MVLELIYSFLNYIVEIIRGVLGPWARLPLSAVTTFVISTLVTLIPSLTMRAFVDINWYKEKQREIAKLQRQLLKAKDEKTMRRLRERIMREQGKMTRASMKNWIVTMPLFFILFIILYGVFDEPYVVYFPILGSGLPFFWWYFLVAMGMGTVINKAFGLSPV